jgi:NADH-quinone oxidoreductase subunit L
MSIFDFAWLIPLLPLLAFVVISLFAHQSRTLSQQLAMYGIVISSVLAQMMFWAAATAAGELPAQSAPIVWFTLGEQPLPLGLYIDPVSAVMLFALSLICLMVFVYAVGAMQDDPRCSRFFAVLSLLAASALGLLVFDNLLLFFIFWEIMDVCAYLLIGFWHERKSARRAGLKAFLVTRVGDLCLLLGLALLYAETGSLVYNEAFDTEATAAIALLLFGGVVGKTAQFPLHVWLPEATEAPIPASTLIHVATSAAGALLLVRTLPLFGAAADSLMILGLGVTIVALIGILTALFAALIAVVQRDVRRALSFSTISQLGYVVAALGIGAYTAGVFHLVISMFINTLLFLAAGSVTRGMARGGQDEPGGESFDPNDMFNMGGLRRRQFTTFLTFLVGALALSGLPFITAGFWSKDAILIRAWADSQVVFWVLALTAGVTAFGAMRQVCLIFIGSPRSLAASRASESPPAMTTPLIILMFFAMVLGWAGIPEQPLPGLVPNWFETFLGAKSAARDFVWEPTSLGIAFGVSGLTLSFLIYAWRFMETGEMDRLEKAARRVGLGWLYGWMRDGFYIDRLYRWAFVKIAIWPTTALDRFDRALDCLVSRTARVGWDIARGGDRFDVQVLDPLLSLANRLAEGLSHACNAADLRLDRLVNGTGQASRGLARTSDVLEVGLTRLVDLTARAGKRLSHVGNAFDLGLERLVGLTGPGMLILAELSDAVDRVLDIAVDGVGSAVRVSGLWFRPRTGRVQSYLLLASVALLVLVAIFLFLFLQI